MSTAKKPAGLRVVLDTNVYFSAFTHVGGVPYSIWQKAVDHSFTLLISPAIFREVGRVLREKVRWQEDEIIAHLRLLARVGEIVSPTTTITAIVEDDEYLFLRLVDRLHVILPKSALG